MLAQCFKMISNMTSIRYRLLIRNAWEFSLLPFLVTQVWRVSFPSKVGYDNQERFFLALRDKAAGARKPNRTADQWCFQRKSLIKRGKYMKKLIDTSVNRAGEQVHMSCWQQQSPTRRNSSFPARTQPTKSKAYFLCLLSAFQLSSPLYKSLLFPLPCGNLHLELHVCRCWSLQFSADPK